MVDAFLYGQASAAEALDEFNSLRFLVKQQISFVRTGVPVKVITVHGGGLGLAPTVDVQPVINQIDAAGNSGPHGTLFGLPAPRVQGGTSGIIIDPVVGDVGHAVASDRDHSSVARANWAVGNPGSFRRYNLADLVYHPNCLNGATPMQYLWFQNGIVTLSDSNGNIVQMQAGKLTINPGSGIIYLGGDGVTGSYAFVQTASGLSINVKARFA